VDKGDAVDIFGSAPKSEEGIAVDPGNEAYVAEEGNAILVHTDGSFAPDATAVASAYVFSRGAAGWGMSVLAQSIDDPQEVEKAKLFDPKDLSEVGFVDEVGTHSELNGGDESAFHHTVLVGPPDGPYEPLYSLSGLASEELNEEEIMAGGSENLSRVVLESKNHSLAAGAEGQDEGTDVLYEATGGECEPMPPHCSLIDVNEEGRAMPCGATLGQGELSLGGAHSAVSSDGSRIFFTAPEPSETGKEAPTGPGCWNGGVENPPELYMREGGARTVKISAPEAGVKVGTPGNPDPENPELPSVFVGASSDGSKVFFMTKTELTKNAVGHTPELYEYETASGRLALISAGESGMAEGDVDSVTAVSSDGSAVFFTAYGDLAPGASQYPLPPEEEVSAPVNLYRYDTITGETTYVTTLNKDSYPAVFGEAYNWYTAEFGGHGAEEEGLSYAKEWYTTGDGRFLVFGTVLPLTGFDNTHAPGVTCPNNYTGGEAPEGCFELYRYDAVTKQIVCVSCAGGAPVDGAYFARSSYFDSPASGPPRPISEDGKEVFFESANVLVPQATPGKVHVYEWHEGTISLISSPNDPGNALFLGSSGTGSDVFFVTHAQLVPQDTDQAADIYDARVDGGFGGLTPPQCTGTGCQGVPAAPPIFATPAGVTFEGVGNFTTTEPPRPTPVISKPKVKKCPKGKKLSHGKCVKRSKVKKAKKASRGTK